MAKPLEADLYRIDKYVDLSFLEDKAVLITGASGLIGAYVSELISTLMYFNRGPRKLELSSFSGKMPTQGLSSDYAQWVSGDLTSVETQKKLGNYDVIIHAAGYGQPNRFSQDKLKTLELNTTCTSFLIKRLNNDGHFLFFSSSEVYSGSQSSPHSENDIGNTTPSHPRAAYIEGKRAGEAIVNAAREQLGIRAYSARLSLAYGPGTQRGDRRVINEFIRMALLNGEVSLLDGGEAKRTYCYVSDAVLQSLTILAKGKDSTYNVGGVSKTTILGLANLIAEMTGASVRIPPKSNGLDDAPREVEVDLSRILDLTNRPDFVSLDAGLARTIEWQRDHLYQNPMH
jgi:nucleoside-diphosphate-sugar epimerase